MNQHSITCPRECEHMSYNHRTGVRTYPPTVEYLAARGTITTKSAPTGPFDVCQDCGEDDIERLHTTVAQRREHFLTRRTLCGPCIRDRYL